MELTYRDHFITVDQAPHVRPVAWTPVSLWDGMSVDGTGLPPAFGEFHLTQPFGDPQVGHRFREYSGRGESTWVVWGDRSNPGLQVIAMRDETDDGYDTERVYRVWAKVPQSWENLPIAT